MIERRVEDVIAEANEAFNKWCEADNSVSEEDRDRYISVYLATQVVMLEVLRKG